MVLKFFFAFGQVDENGEIQQMEFKDYGVIVDGGNKVYVKGFNHYEMDKITDKEFEDITNDYDDIEAPPGPYKIQPEKKGMNKILFLLIDYCMLIYYEQERYCGYLEHLEWENHPLLKFLQEIMTMFIMRVTVLEP